MNDDTPGRVETLRHSLQSPGLRDTRVDVALAAARVALAWIFIYHGAGTLFGLFHGPGLHAEATFFSTTAHLHPGLFFATLSGVIECFGGLAVGVGLFARLAALGLFGDMVIAMVTVTFKNGLVSNAIGSGYELNLALAALAVVVVVLGAGTFSGDALLRRWLNQRTS